MKVKDVMVDQVATVDVATPLHDVAALLAERGFSGVPVVDDGAVVGVVSEADFLVKEQGSSPPRRRGLLGWLLEPETAPDAAKLEARTAGEAMTSPAITVEPGAPVARAASLMVDNGVNRLPVTESGRLVGIVTRADLVRGFVRDDAEIAREVREDVILKQFWIEPSTLRVAVEDGIVRLGGEVDRKGEAELLAAFVGRVPGVVAVESGLTWRGDDR